MMAGVAELERNLIAEGTGLALAHKKAHRELYARICPPGKSLEKIEITREKIFGNDALITYVLGFSGGEKRQETAALIKLQGAWKIVKIASR